MKVLAHVRLLTYAAFLLALFLLPQRHRLVPVSLTSGSVWLDEEEAKPVHYLERSRLKQLPATIHEIKLPCSDREFFAAVGLDPVKANFPINVTSRARYSVVQYLIVPRDENGWGCELALFKEYDSKSGDKLVHRAEVWVTRSHYPGREPENFYAAHDSSYYIDAISTFLKRGPDPQE